VSLGISVLAVDDEPGMLHLVTAVLGKLYDVVTARSTAEALQRISLTEPDVVITDVRMPGDSGLVLLGRIRESHPHIPVILMTGYGDKEIAVSALKTGAFDYLDKPFSNSELIASMERATAHCLLKRLDSSIYEKLRSVSAQLNLRQEFSDSTVVAVGASFGGTEAIADLMSQLPRHMPPMVITLHVPPTFSADYASRLNKISQIHVQQAEGGELLRPGTAFLAPGGKHLAVRKSARATYVTDLLDTPPVHSCKPSVDVLFHSVANTLGANAIGIVLTGMGSDGAEGLLSMLKAGAKTFAQDQASSKMFAMPKASIDAGAVEHIVSLKEMPAAIIKCLSACQTFQGNVVK
jgi:two-component system chemotaxis response regulator CheB